MVSMKTVGRKIDFVGHCISESTAYFFFIILNFVLQLLLKSKFLKTHFYRWKPFLPGLFKVLLGQKFRKGQLIADEN